MSADWEKLTKDFWDNQPHPHAPSLKIKDYATAVKLATMAKFGGHASAHEAALFWPEFQASGLTPQEFEHALDHVAPLSFTYHGRPPTMREITQLKDKQPHEARRYFADLPDKDYPHVSAGDMVKAMRAADPHARQHLERPAVKWEAQYLHHSGEHPSAYYARVAAQDQQSETTLAPDGTQTPVGPDAGGRGVHPVGGPSPDQRA